MILKESLRITEQTRKSAAIFAVAFSLSIFFICLDEVGVRIEADSAIYFAIAKNIAAGHGFSSDAVSPHLPTMSREPVYPFFLSTIFFFFGSNVLVVQLFQAFIYALTCIVVFKIVSSILPDIKWSFFISIIIAVFPTIANYTAHLITEVLFTFLLAVSLLTLIKSFKNDLMQWYFYSGILVGVTTLCRAILMFFFVFVLVAIFVHCYRKYKTIITSKLAIASFLFLIGYTITVMPWMFRNYILLDKFSITLRGFSSMYVRAEKVNLDENELKMYAAYSLSEYLAGKLYPGYNLTSTGNGYFYQPLLKKIHEYSDMGLSQEEADSMFKQESMVLISSHPVKFFAMGIFEIIKFNSFSQILLLNEQWVEDIIKKPYISILRGILKLTGFFIFIFAILGVFFTLRDWYKWMILLSVILYFNFMHSLVDAVGRYALPIIPYYIFFSILGVKGILGMCRMHIPICLSAELAREYKK